MAVHGIGEFLQKVKAKYSFHTFDQNVDKKLNDANQIPVTMNFFLSHPKAALRV
jgi:hypothetical protein